MKIKKAFTLAELLIVLLIIGVISIMALTTFKRFDKAIRYLYSNTYYLLDRAYYNAFNFARMPSPFADNDIDPDTGQPFEVTDAMGTERVCNMLAEYLNGSASCISGEAISDPDGVLASEDGRFLGPVQFTTDHGVLIYLSKRLPAPEDLPDGGHRFFLMYVDLNGQERPNSMEYTRATADNPNPPDPDIFAFAILDTGRICPLGPPETDQRYMQARIAYVDHNGAGEDGTVITRYTTVSVPYYIAKAQAWGYYVDNNINFDRVPIDDEPTSYNDYIRSLLPADNEIYKFMDGAASITLPVDFTGMDVEHGCETRFNEQCWVIVDRFMF